MTEVSFTAYGIAQPAGSKTAGRTKDGRMFVRDSAKGSAGWKKTVAQVAGAHMTGRDLLTGPLVLDVRFYMPRPKGHYRTGRRADEVRPTAPAWPTVRPDCLKLARAVEDALSGIVYQDDAQIVVETLRKDYGTPARVEIHVSQLEPASSIVGAKPEPAPGVLFDAA